MLDCIWAASLNFLEQWAFPKLSAVLVSLPWKTCVWLCAILPHSGLDPLDILTMTGYFWFMGPFLN